MSIYDVNLIRGTSEEITLRVSARNAKTAGVLAKELAIDDTDLIWNVTDYEGDVLINRVSKVNKNEIKELFNATNTPPTNIEFITEIMTLSQFGALAEIFVLDALTKFTKQVVEATPEDLRAMDNCLIRSVSWQGVAREIQHKLARRFTEKS